MNSPSKPWWQSRTILGAIIVIVSTVASLFGWSVDSEATTEIAMQVASVVGAVLAIYGRVVAEQPIRRVRRALPAQDGNPRIPRGGLDKGGVNWSVLCAIAVIVVGWAVAIWSVVWICNFP